MILALVQTKTYLKTEAVSFSTYAYTFKLYTKSTFANTLSVHHSKKKYLHYSNSEVALHLFHANHNTNTSTVCGIKKGKPIV